MGKLWNATVPNAVCANHGHSGSAVRLARIIKRLYVLVGRVVWYFYYNYTYSSIRIAVERARGRGGVGTVKKIIIINVFRFSRSVDYGTTGGPGNRRSPDRGRRSVSNRFCRVSKTGIRSKQRIQIVRRDRGVSFDNRGVHPRVMS